MTSPTLVTGALKPILMRSATPGSNEKVLKYLESMKDTADEPRSMLGEDPYLAGTPRNDRKVLEGSLPVSPKVLSPSPRKGKAIHQLEELANADLKSNGKPRTNGGDIEEGVNDAMSNVQDGQRSDIGELPTREPGPNDPPGPRYESFDSGPSFGNMGPLPPDTYTWQAWRPNQLISPHQQAPLLTANGLNGTSNGLHPSRFPDSVLSQKAANPPSSLSKIKGHHSDNEDRLVSPMSPKSASKMAVRKSPDADRLLSPLSSRSKVTGKTPGTVYPPLPASLTGDTYMENIPSPRSRALSKAPSISPSDSPSQIKPPNSRAKSPPLSPIKALETPWEREGGADVSRSNSNQLPLSPTGRSQGLGSAGPHNHQTRQFSPYRHAPTQEDLLHAVIRGQAVTPPEPNGREKEQFVHSSGKQTVGSPSKVPSALSTARPATAHSRILTKADADATPTPSRPHSPVELNQEEERIVRETLSKTPLSSYYGGSTVEPENSRFHDTDLCILLHEEKDPSLHDVVKRALRKAINQRMKKLGLKYDRDSIRQYRKSFHDHDPSVHLNPNHVGSTITEVRSTRGIDSERIPGPSTSQEAPGWAKEILDGMARMQDRIEGLVPKIDDLRESHPYNQGHTFHSSEIDQYGRTPMTQTVNIHTQPTGTVADSMFQQPETEVVVENNDGDNIDDEFDEVDEESRTGRNRGYSDRRLHTDGGTRTHGAISDFDGDGRDVSPGQQYFEEELYKLRQKPRGSQSALSHRTWELARDDDPDGYYDNVDDDDDQGHQPGVSGLPTIPDMNGPGYSDQRPPSPPLPPLPDEMGHEVIPTGQQQIWHPGDYSNEAPPLPHWQRIHQRLLNWAMAWPVPQLDNALNSTTRGHQVDEVALTIWSTQTYKRYLRSKMTDSQQGVVDRLFVPPNVADVINNAVYHGRHGDACGMLRDLWSPFGLEGIPRLLVVLAKHRSDADHWVVHRFSLPDGGLTTYDCFSERTLPDGRPLGWWFAIRVAWPNAIYPSPDNLVQKIVRLHRPMQLPIDNSVAAAGIWRNILMGSRAERSLDLERLRDLINTEVHNLRQRKSMGKLSIAPPRPVWEDMN